MAVGFTKRRIEYIFMKCPPQIGIVAAGAQLTSNSTEIGTTTRVLLDVGMTFELLGTLIAVIFCEFYQQVEPQSDLLRIAARTPVVLILTGMAVLTIALVVQTFQ
jgi:hypothetical protein